MQTSFIEKIKVNGLACEIEFERLYPKAPVEIITVNKIPSVDLVPEFIEDCRAACSEFLTKQPIL